MRVRFVPALSSGFWLLAALGIVAGVALSLQRPAKPARQIFWLTARAHQLAYAPIVEDWNRGNPDASVSMVLFDGPALEQRMLAGLLSRTPISDLLEVERSIAGRAFTGPPESIGFVDLTDRLREEGLLDAINPSSLSPWMHRGRIFGLPHDVHPVLLAYRADLVEAAGIDVSQVETWDDFARVFRPLLADRNGDGEPDRYLLNFWPTNPYLPETLLLQAGGGFFDAQNRPTLDSEVSVHVAATLASWLTGPTRLAIDAPEFNAGGNQLRLNGVVIATIMPDWVAGAWKNDLPSLAGKIKLMPLPAWERGGRRTSATGGTMLAIPKTTSNPDAAWRFAKHLYFSPALAERFYRASNIIPPTKTLWTLPVFAEPDPYFCGQPAGRLFIEQAAHVPARPASPYNHFGVSEYTDVLLALKSYAERVGDSRPAALESEARRLLGAAQLRLERRIQGNAFLRTTP